MPDSSQSRRRFLGSAALASAASLLPRTEVEAGPAPDAAPGKGSVIVTSSNGVEAARTARQALIQGKDPLDAAILGVNVVELDPEDMSVGYGGIPNEEGVVELDASVMDGRTMRAGAVGALRGVKTPSRVARLVMERTDRVFLVGEGARRFASTHGFENEELLTEKTRKIWLYWRDRLSDRDDWEEAASDSQDPVIQQFVRRYGDEHFRPQGTIHLSIRSAKGELVGVTSTSGLFFKIPGRLGDSPVIGAGLYSEGGVGSCGSTGRGEANLVTCGSHSVIELLRNGRSPEQACLEVLERISKKTHLVPRHRDAKNRPKFNVTLYCVDDKGRPAGASIWSGAHYVVGDDDGIRSLDCAYLYKKG